jgi:hypothetical protein
LITVDYSGSTGSGTPYASGTAFSGSFAYDSAAAATFVSNFADFPLNSFTLNIGGDTLNESSGHVQVNNNGAFEVFGNPMTGTGPLNGGVVTLVFPNSSRPGLG